jgi:serpin B
MRAIKLDFILLVMLPATAGCPGKEQMVTTEKSDSKIIVEGNNKFAMALFAELRENQGNLFFSPYSISTALALAYSGANGKTEFQMANALYFPTTLSNTIDSKPYLKKEQFHSAFGSIVKDLNARGRKGSYELTIANALWGQKGYGFQKEFLELVKTNYDGQLNEVDFVKAAESARKTINAWIEKKTNEKIKDLIKPDVLDAMTRLVLTNAIYFKGNWAQRFKEEQTRNAQFTLLNADKIEVPMMNQTEQFPYMETDDFQVLEIPYVDNELSMVILLPKQVTGLKELEQKLSLENVSQWLSELNKREVIVFVPKFKMTNEFSLAAVLKSMGMTDAFEPEVADFSGMTGGRDLFISAVIHKAYVEVNEEGTEAAAATGVTMRLTSVGPSQTPIFRADHPFLFLIRDCKSGSILFIGRVMHPKA